MNATTMLSDPKYTTSLIYMAGKSKNSKQAKYWFLLEKRYGSLKDSSKM